MGALLVALGALMLAVLVGVLLDPRPARTERADPDLSPEIDDCVPASCRWDVAPSVV
jgi:hypothetical protein